MAISRMQEPRQLYGLGSLVKKIGKTVKKVIKSPIGKAALIGLGGAGLMGMGPLSGLGGLGSKIGGAVFSKTGGLGALLGGAGGAAKNFFSGLSTGGKFALGGALTSILAASGMGAEEIEETKRDPEKVKMYLRDYYSKTNPDKSADEVEEFVNLNVSEYAVGGRVGLKSGTPKYKINDFAIDEQAARLGFKRYYLKDMSEDGETYDADEVREMIFGDQYAVGGRVGLEKGTPKKGLESLSKEDMKKFRITLPNKIEYDEDGNRIEREIPRTKGPAKYDPDRDIKRLLLRNKSAFGGLQSMPMGQMRRNKAGTIERDYRETGGFVPVGIKEKADDVPAMLSKNEFVMTADAVRGMGGGNIEKGAQRLYDQMKQAEKRVV
jgi:hypothetical protein